MRTLEYIIDQPPIALKRARHYRGYVVDPSKPDKIVYINTLKAAYPNIKIVNEPFIANFQFHFPIPKSLSRKKYYGLIGTPHTNKIDIDNVIKFFLDIGNEILWSDDCLCWKLTASKTYSDKPRVVIDISFP